MIKKFLGKVKLRTWIAMSIFVILIPLVLVSLYHPAESKAEWFNDTWQYRVPWSFTHNAALTDRRVGFTISATNTLVTNGKLLSSCNDVRFTDNVGKILRTQLTGSCNSASTTYDVIIPTVINGLNTGYLYYGNPGAPTVSEDVSAFGSTSPSGGAPAFATEEKGTAPVAYWGMDQGVDNTCSGGTNDACNGTQNSLDGAISGGTLWQTEDKCVSGKCLYFDGTDDVVDVANGNAIDLDLSGGLLGGFTFEAWIRPNGAGEGTGGRIFTKGTNTWLRVDTLSAGKLDIETNIDEATDATLNVSAKVVDNQWNHVAISYTDDADDEITIWVNGINVGSSTNGVGPLAADANSLRFGNDTGTAATFKGSIDEFKIYNFERSSAQIITDAQRSGIGDAASAQFGVNDTKFLNNGLVDYFPMDETAVNGCPTATADSCDKSGNTSDGVWNGNATNSSGKFGQSVTMDGTGDYVKNPDIGVILSSNNPFTIGAWINVTSVALHNAVIGRYSGNPFEFAINSSGGIQYENDITYATANSLVSANTWTHVLITHNGTNTVKFYINGSFISSATTASVDVSGMTTSIGHSFGGDYNGKIDEVRIYNRELSGREVSALYNWAPGPVGYWKMDESAGTSTSYDSSGNGNNLTIGTGAGSDGSDMVYAPGKFGSALDGAGDAGNDYARTTSVTNMPTIEGQKSVSLWFYARTAPPCCGTIFMLTDGSSTSIQADLNSTTLEIDRFGRFQLVTTSGITLNTWHHLGYTWDGTTHKLYIDGDFKASSTNAGNSSTPSNFYIGGMDPISTDENFDGPIDDVKLYNYPRTAQQILEDMNGGHPAGGSPIASQVAYWEFDEQQGQTINNSNPAIALTANRGTTSGSEGADFTWKTKEVCKVNGCGDYDGTDDVTTVTNANAIDLNNNLLNGFTMGAWVNPDTVGEGSAGQIFVKSTTTNCALGGSTPFNITCSVDLGTDATVTVNSVIPASTWTHVAVSYTDDADDEITVWINGVARGASTNGVGPTSAESSNLLIGGGTSNNFDGKIDEFQIYSAELTVDQMKVIFNQGGVNNFGVGTDEATQISGGAGNPPVGYWKLDENTGTTANDSSGNSANGTLNGAVYANGKYGSGVNFSADSDDITLTTNNMSSATGTIEFWYKARADYANADTQAMLIGRSNGTGNGDFYINKDSLNFSWGITATTDDWLDIPQATIDDYWVAGVWNHYTATYDIAADDALFYVNGRLIGSDLAMNWGTWTPPATWYIGSHDTNQDADGTIDDVKIYNYVRTPAQIAYDYNRGGPVAWWQLDECTGTTAYDNSGSNLNGTLTPGGAPNTAAGTCTSGNAADMWADGATGKFNASVGLDGTDDYVTVTDPGTASALDMSDDFTVSAWVNWTALPSGESFIVTKGDATLNNYYLDYCVTSCTVNGTLLVSYYNGSTATESRFAITPTLGVWYHVVGVMDDTANTLKLYLDGKLVNTNASATIDPSTTVNNGDLRIGRERNAFGFYFNGKIDDVRVFAYPLSDTQVKKLYDNNAGARFGPSQGTP